MFLNWIKTAILLAALSGLLLFFGAQFGGYSGLQFAFIMALVMNGIAYFFSEKIVLRLYKAQPLNKTDYASVYATVKELSDAMKIPMPKLWLINNSMANAFATGRNPKHASIAITSGIIHILNEDELRGVLAHELAHIKNRDILISTIAATIATAIGYMASMLRYFAFWGALGGGSRRRNGNPLFMILVAILMPIAAALIQLAISRSREFLADETGASYCKDPLALASALQKLHDSARISPLDPNQNSKASTASLFIVHPFSGKGMLSLFSTHPPVAKRIARLRKMYEKMF
ncbi:zinc metalloprotease HtpX [bacterium]|nr:zinc metalloprotease HtpX [bacterium]